MKNKGVKFLLIVTLTLIPFLTSQAEVIIQFDFAGDSAASSDTSIYSSASTWDITNSAPGTSITGGVSSVTANHNVATAPGGLAGISATTVDPTDGGAEWQEFEFTVTGLGAGETLNLTSIDYTYTLVQPLNFQSGVYSNLSGYTGTGDQLGGTANTSTAQTFTPSIDLTGNSAFTGLTNGASVEFRIYLKDGSTNVNSRLHQLDDIVLNGDVVVVPEPSTAILLGLGGLALALVRRRRS